MHPLLQDLNRSRPVKASCVQQALDLFSIPILSKRTHTHTERETVSKPLSLPSLHVGITHPPPPLPGHLTISLALTPCLYPQIRHVHPLGSAWTGRRRKALHPSCPSPPPQSSPSNLSRFSDWQHRPQQGAEDARGSCTRTAHTQTCHTHAHIPASGGVIAPSFRTRHGRDEVEA